MLIDVGGEDLMKPITILQECAEKGHKTSLRMLGRVLSSNPHLMTAELIPYLERAAVYGTNDEGSLLYSIYTGSVKVQGFDKGSDVVGLFYLMSMAFDGDIGAQYKLGRALVERKYSYYDEATGMAWLNCAAANGSNDAAAIIAYNLNFNKKIVAGFRKGAAANIYAASGGSASAQNNLGVQVYYGQGLKADSELGDYLIQMSKETKFREGTLWPAEPPVSEKRPLAKILTIRKQ
jgi:hypothetical protein